MRRKLWQLINCKVDDFDQLQLFCQRLTVRWHLHAISIANLLRIRVCSLFSWTRLPYLHLNLKSARLKAIDRFWSANASTLPKTHTNWIKHEFESSWQVQNLPIKTKRSTLKKKMKCSTKIFPTGGAQLATPFVRLNKRREWGIIYFIYLLNQENQRRAISISVALWFICLSGGIF